MYVPLGIAFIVQLVAFDVPVTVFTLSFLDGMSVNSFIAFRAWSSSALQINSTSAVLLNILLSIGETAWTFGGLSTPAT